MGCLSIHGRCSARQKNSTLVLWMMKLIAFSESRKNKMDYLSIYDFTFKSEVDIEHDEKITGRPIGIPCGNESAWWDNYYTLDALGRLWSNNRSINLWFEKTTELGDVLLLQDTTPIELTVKGKKHTYYIGEVQVEALVKYHKSGSYYSCLNTVYEPNSLGDIVGVRILNVSEELLGKYKYRDKVHREYWKLYPDRVIANRVNKNGVLVKNIKPGDIFYQLTSIGRQSVRISESFSLVTDMPDQQIWTEIVDLSPEAANRLDVDRGGWWPIDSLYPLDAPPEESDWEQERREEYEKIAKEIRC